MKGKEYFQWFTEEEKSKWSKNFEKIGFDDFEGFDDVMETNFGSYFMFTFGCFSVDDSNEGGEYWTNLFLEYKKYDNLRVKPNFGPLGILRKPKIF